MKKVLSLIFSAVIIAHIFLTGTPEFNEKPELSLSMLMAKADGNSENDPPDPPKGPILYREYPDSIFVFIIP